MSPTTGTPFMNLKSVFFFLFLAGTMAGGQQPALTPTQQLARDIFKELIEINTTDTPAGNVTAAADAMAVRVRAAGYAAEDVQVLGPLANKHNLVVRLRGRNRDANPILFIGHLDVVQALKQDWSPNLDPFKFTEAGG